MEFRPGAFVSNVEPLTCVEMDTGLARQLFLRFSGAIAYVAVERPDGVSGIGAAFHVGEGVFVTARHVVEGREIREIASTEDAHIPMTDPAEIEHCRTHIRVDGKDLPVHWVQQKALNLDVGPFFHPDAEVDLAVFRVKDSDPHMPWVPLGDHLDDWLGQSDFTLSEVVVFGYPPIPFTNKPQLFVARAEVNAHIDLRHAKHPHFVVSATPRGGFSGGPAITEHGFALGLVTTSLIAGDGPLELGFFTVLSVEPIYVCLSSHKLLPDCQASGWDGLWNTETEYFQSPTAERVVGRRIDAEIGVFDDGKRLYIELSCQGTSDLVAEMRGLSAEHLSPLVTRVDESNPSRVRLHIEAYTPLALIRLEAARKAARELLLEKGYMPI